MVSSFIPRLSNTDAGWTEPPTKHQSVSTISCVSSECDTTFVYDKLKRKQFFGSNENAVFERRNSDNYALEHKFSLAKYIFYTFWKRQHLFSIHFDSCTSQRSGVIWKVWMTLDPVLPQQKSNSTNSIILTISAQLLLQDVLKINNTSKWSGKSKQLILVLTASTTSTNSLETLWNMSDNMQKAFSYSIFTYV